MKNSMEKKYKYLGYFLLLLIPITFAGFYRTYISQFPNFEESIKDIDTYVHIHALISSAWILILIIQPFLIQNKKNKFHRTIGKISYIIFPLLILSFIPLIIKSINVGKIPFTFLPLSDLILLIVFYSLGIYNRRTVAKHMRYMIVTAIVLLGPTMSRMGIFLLGWSLTLTQHILHVFLYTLFISLILYDKANNKNYLPYKLGLFCYIIHHVLFYIILA
jgi:hypothetical protein